MRQHADLLQRILDDGDWVVHHREGRPPIRLLQVFAPTDFNYDMVDGIPLITQRKVPYKNAIREFLWMISGSTNNEELLAQNCPVWRLWDLRPEDLTKWGKDVDARGNPISVGSCGPIYGKMWRSWPSFDGKGIDQLQYVLDTLKTKPYSRRIIVTGWNPDVLPDENFGVQENILMGRQALPPCHTMYHFGTTWLSAGKRLYYANRMEWPGKNGAVQSLFDSWMSAEYFDRDFDIKYPTLAQSIHAKLDGLNVPKYRLNLKMVARSQDLPLGTVFNQFAYSVFLHMMAAQVNMFPGVYTHSMNDAHIYEDQIPMVREQLTRDPRPFPKITLNPAVKSLFDYRLEDFTLSEYDPHPKIDFPLTK